MLVAFQGHPRLYGMEPYLQTFQMYFEWSHLDRFRHLMNHQLQLPLQSVVGENQSDVDRLRFCHYGTLYLHLFEFTFVYQICSRMTTLVESTF